MTQTAYIRAEDELIDRLKVEVILEAVFHTAVQINTYIEGALTAVNERVNELQNLYSQLQQESSRLGIDRAAAKDVIVHKIVTDHNYERMRYEHYLTIGENDRRSELLESIQWGVDHRIVGGQNQLQLTMSMASGDEKFSLMERNDLALMLNMCRQPFLPARQAESVVSYLMEYAYEGDGGAEKLAREIYENNGALLNYQGVTPLRSLHLIAANDTNKTRQNYLHLVLQSLSQLMRINFIRMNDENDMGQIGARYLNSEDRFKLLAIWSEDLIELEMVSSFKKSKSDYLSIGNNSMGEGRRMLHIFPAEVNATQYEARLPEIQQPSRIFSDKVTLQLEDPKEVRLFLLLYAYDLIERNEAGMDQPYWRLLLPPKHKVDTYGNSPEPIEIWLTKLGDDNLLNALNTFVFERRDIRHKERYNLPIDYEHTKMVLAQKRDEDAHWDTLRDMQRRIEERMLRVYENDLPNSQAKYDMASVFALMIRDEVDFVQQRINTASSLGLEENKSDDLW